MHKYKVGKDSIDLLHQILVAKMYDDYDTNEDFLPQITQRMENLKVELDDLFLDRTRKSYYECYEEYLNEDEEEFSYEE